MLQAPEASSSARASPLEAAPSRGEGFTSITAFGWDSGGYDNPWVYVYVTLEGVGEVKDGVTCDFTRDSFDLRVMGLKGKAYRLLKDNLEKDIVPEESKVIVKKDRVTIKMKKVKGDYSYETW